MRWIWSSTVLLLAPLSVGLVAGPVGCKRAAAPDPLFDLELAQSSTAEGGEAVGDATWITVRSVVVGSRIVGPIVDGGLGPARAEVARAVESQRGEAPLVLGVDRRAAFGAAWGALSERHREEAVRVSLLVGDRSSPGRIDVCGARARRRPGPVADDCWGRREGRPSPRGEEPEGGGQPSGPAAPAASRGPADAGPSPGSETGANADGLVAPSFDLSAPLRLEMLLGAAAVSLRAQGRLVRVLELRGPSAAVLDQMGQTLATFRIRNDWERRATVRVTRVVEWGDVVALLDRLRAARFDQIRLEAAVE